MVGLACCAVQQVISNQRLCANRGTDSKEYDGFQPPRSIALFLSFDSKLRDYQLKVHKIDKQGPCTFSSIAVIKPSIMS